MCVYAESVKYVRLLTGDKDPSDYIFSDEDIEGMLFLNGGNVYRAAADVLESIAANSAYTLRVVTILGVTTNGASTADGIRQSAAALRKRADDEDAKTIVCGIANVTLPQLPTHWRPWWEALA